MSTSSSSCRIEYILYQSRDQELKRNSDLNKINYISSVLLNSSNVTSCPPISSRCRFSTSVGSRNKQENSTLLLPATDWNFSTGSKCGENIYVNVWWWRRHWNGNGNGVCKLVMSCSIGDVASPDWPILVTWVETRRLDTRGTRGWFAVLRIFFPVGRLGLPAPVQCPGRFLGITSWYPSVSQVQPVTCWHPPVFLLWIGEYSKYSSNMNGNFPAILNFNWFFLKLNWFICT